MIETREDHLNYLGALKDFMCGEECRWAIAPHLSGSFCFGKYVDLSTYVELYEKECKKRGWL